MQVTELVVHAVGFDCPHCGVRNIREDSDDLRGGSAHCTDCGGEATTPGYCTKHQERKRKLARNRARAKRGIPLDRPLARTGRPRNKLLTEVPE